MAATMRVVDALRRIGAKNSPGGQDSNLVYVNDNELAQLYAGGGKGYRDPQTGILHMAQDVDGPDGPSGGEAAGSGASDNGGTDGSGSPSSHTGENDNEGDQVNPTGEGGVLSDNFTDPTVDSTLNDTTPTQSVPDGGYSTNWSKQLTPEEANQLTYGSGSGVYGFNSDYSGTGKWVGRLLGGLLLGPMGAYLGGMAGSSIGAGIEKTDGGWGGLGSSGQEGTGDGGPGGPSTGSNSREGGNGSSLTGTTATGASSGLDVSSLSNAVFGQKGGTTTVTPATPAFDLFSSAPRARYTSQDQILAGLGIIGSNVKKPGMGA